MGPNSLLTLAILLYCYHTLKSQSQLGVINLQEIDGISYTFLLFGAFCLTTPSLSIGQASQIHFDPVEIPGASPFPAVECIYQDSKGFLWVGSYDGLYRYDGYELKHFVHNPNDTLSMCDNKVRRMLEDSQGYLWIGTQLGLSRMDPRTETFQNFNDISIYPMGQSTITCLLETPRSNIWIGSHSGLFQADFQSMTFFEKPLIDDSSKIQSLLSDSKGYLWVASVNGIYRQDTISKQFELKLDRAEILNGDDYFLTLQLGVDANLWLLTTKTLFKLRVSDGKLTILGNFQLNLEDRKPPRFPYGHLLSLDKQLLIGTNSGLLKFDLEKPTFDLLPIDKSDPGNARKNNVSCLYISSNDQLWLEKGSGILYQGDLRMRQFRQLSLDLLSFVRNAANLFQVHEYAPDTLLLPGNDGLRYLLIKTGQTKEFPYSPGYNLAGWYTGATTFEEDGHYLWIGTSGGLFQFDKKKKVFIDLEKKFTDSKILRKYSIRDLLKDHLGNLWVATWDHGLYKFDFDVGTFYRSDLTISKQIYANTSSCRSLYQDSRDNVWLGTRQGLYQFVSEADTFRGYHHDPSDPESMSENTAFCIYEDSLGFIWTGSYGGGLNRMNPQTGKFRHFTIEDGLLGNNVFSLLPDDGGNLWLMSYRGLTKFNPYTFHTTNYTYRNGLINKKYDAFLYGKSPYSGKLFFGGDQGIDFFHPDSIRPSDFTPPIVFTGFELFNEAVPINRAEQDEAGYSLPQSISYTSDLELSYDHKVFTITYAGLDYAGPQNIDYAYRMEGFDDDWQYVGSKRSATYTNLDPGQYSFQVKCTNADGIWNEAYTSLAITINPPWWATWLAYVGYILLIAGVIYLFMRYQLRRWELKTALQMQEREAMRLKELDALKTNLYTNITHEFRTPLTVIQGMADLVHQQPKKWLNKGVRTIEDQCSKLLYMVNQMLDLQKIEAGKMSLNLIQSDVIAYINYLVEPFQFQAKAKGLDFLVQHTNQSLMTDFDPEKLQVVVTNLISNALKYTDEGKVTLHTFTQNGAFYMDIKDTGIGMDEATTQRIFDRFYQSEQGHTRRGEGTGIGLSLVKDLLTLMHGSIEVISTLNQGSTFTVCLPLTHEAPLVTDLKILPGYSISLPHPADNRLPLIPSKSKSTLLLIDDHHDVLAYLRAMLDNDFQIIEAHHGEEGIAKALELVPDLIVSDVMMPFKDGYQVCRTLHQNELTSHIPIILLTAKADHQSTVQGYDVGADAYISKPFHAGELKAQIKMLLNQRARLQEKYQQQMNGTPAKAPTDKLLRRLQELILSDLSNEGLDVKQICQKMLVSRSQLHNKIKATTGMSTSHFIRKIRLTEARKLLRSSSLTIAEVAYQVGMSDPNYFSRIYKKEYGEAPSASRNNS